MSSRQEGGHRRDFHSRRGLIGSVRFVGISLHPPLFRIGPHLAQLVNREKAHPPFPVGVRADRAAARHRRASSVRRAPIFPLMGSSLRRAGQHSLTSGRLIFLIQINCQLRSMPVIGRWIPAAQVSCRAASSGNGMATPASAGPRARQPRWRANHRGRTRIDPSGCRTRHACHGATDDPLSGRLKGGASDAVRARALMNELVIDAEHAAQLHGPDEVAAIAVRRVACDRRAQVEPRLGRFTSANHREIRMQARR